jgi:hypothetical protein
MCFADTTSINNFKPIVTANWVNPELVGLAGQSLKTFQTRYFAGLGCMAVGTCLCFVALKDNTMLPVGYSLLADGIIVNFIAFSQLGKAGDFLVKATE